MALNPRFAGQAFPAGSTSASMHTVEIFLDYVCPYSAKLFKTVHGSVFPLLAEKYPSKVRFIFRQQIQPWHPSSTLCHEAATAVLRLEPGKFYDFSAKLFEQQTGYFDVCVVNEVRNDTYKRLAKLAGTVGVNEEKILDMLRIPDRPGEDGALNSGNEVTDDVKLMVKANRLTGVHVTPTVLFDGIVENSISSSFSTQDWEKWLNKNCL